MTWWLATASGQASQPQNQLAQFMKQAPSGKITFFPMSTFISLKGYGSLSTASGLWRRPGDRGRGPWQGCMPAAMGAAAGSAAVRA